jgi:hypothetical protein
MLINFILLFFKLISWSEIGLFYFVGGFISLLVAGEQAASILLILAWMNVAALPYTIFSIYYQWRVAKQWCILCLTTQVLLIAEFIAAFFLGSFLNSILISDNSVQILLASFILPCMMWFFLKTLLLQNQEAKRRKRELLRFKYDNRIF